MPTYEYRCAACAHTFEEFQSITADPFEICPQCGKPTLRRILGGGAGMIFKGSGFYLTDYRKPDSTSSAKRTTKGSDSTKPSAPESTSSPEKPSQKKD